MTHVIVKALTDVIPVLTTEWQTPVPNLRL